MEMPLPMLCHLLVDGRKVEPTPDAQGLLSFQVRLPAREVRLVSPAGRPAARSPTNDARLLGVQVFGLCWRQGETRQEVPLAGPGFGEGFHDLEESAFRWTNGNALLARPLLPDWTGEATLHLRAAPLPPDYPLARSPHPDAALLTRFESLGDDCELGFVQRHFDATPPLGLFRWAGSSHAQLLAGLESGFAGLGEPAQTTLEVRDGEYRLCTPYMRMHSFHTAATDTPEERAAVLRRGCSLLRLLRRKLLDEIAGSRRFFVFKSADPAFDRAAMLRLHAALRRHGPAPLLCVTLSPPGSRGGGVERVERGLYAAKLERFVLAEGPYADWRQVCFRASMLHQAENP